MPADGSCPRSLRVAIASWPARVAGRKGHGFAGSFISSVSFPPSRAHRRFAWSTVAPTSCRGLRRSAVDGHGLQAQGCCFEIRRGTGPVQIHPAGMTASRDRDVMETLSAGLGGEGLAA